MTATTQPGPDLDALRDRLADAAADADPDAPRLARYRASIADALLPEVRRTVAEQFTAFGDHEDRNGSTLAAGRAYDRAAAWDPDR